MKQAMIFAAGLGTRLKPITDITPKALIEIDGQPLLGRLIVKLKAAGFERIVVNVHHLASQIMDYLKANDNFGVEILVSDESKELLDTGGGLKKAAPLFSADSQILLHNVDILSNVDLGKFYAEGPLMHNYGSDGNLEASATLLVSWRETSRYLLFDSQMRLVGWTNVKTGEVKSPYKWLREFGAEHHEEFTSLISHHKDIHVRHRLLGYGEATLQAYAFSGIHCFNPSLLPRMQKYADKFSIIDFYLDNCSTAPIKGVVANDAKILDVGKPETLREASLFLSEIQS